MQGSKGRCTLGNGVTSDAARVYQCARNNRMFIYLYTLACDCTIPYDPGTCYSTSPCVISKAAAWQSVFIDRAHCTPANLHPIIASLGSRNAVPGSTGCNFAFVSLLGEPDTVVTGTKKWRAGGGERGSLDTMETAIPLCGAIPNQEHFLTYVRESCNFRQEGNFYFCSRFESARYDRAP